MPEQDESPQRWELHVALVDTASRKCRTECTKAIGGALAKVGQLLWVQGYAIGGDRVAGTSLFDFGDDSDVGLGIVAQVGGELFKGAGALLDAGNRYSAMALVRQLVEVEYLAWAFEEAPTQAADWLRCDRKTRQQMWSPKALRERSGGRFGGSDYWRHCETGGHPTPDARLLLPDHSRTMSDDMCRLDLAAHASGIWAYVGRTCEREPHLAELPEVAVAWAARGRWLESERATPLLQALTR